MAIMKIMRITCFDTNCLRQSKCIITYSLLLLAVILPMGMVLITSADLPPGETVSQWVWFDRTAPVAAVCIGLIVVLCRRKPLPALAEVLQGALLILGGVEAVWGLRQVFGFTASGHSLYALTGSFFNPGPYAGYLAIVLPVCLHGYLTADSQWKRWASGGVGLFVLCVLPASMSRSAWIAGAAACLWVWGANGKAKRLHHIIYSKLWAGSWWKKVGTVSASLTLVALAACLLFVLKPDSARGRLFLWRMSARAAMEQPWTGHGDGNFAAAYGEAQETYFAAGDYAPWEERVAGSPEYAFNEYLQVAVECGWPVLLGLLAVTGFCLYRGTRLGRHGICGGIVSLMVFSLSSYPLQIPAIGVTGATLLGAAVLKGRKWEWVLIACIAGMYGGMRLNRDQRTEQACRDWVQARVLYHTGAYAAAEEAYRPLYPLLKERGSYLFEYGHGMHKQGKYEAADSLLQQAAAHSNDPMILNILGKNAQLQGDCIRAEQWLWRSVHRLPGRIYPYYLLAKLYADPACRQWDKFEEMRRTVLTKEPKVMSTAIREMREELKMMK